MALVDQEDDAIVLSIVYDGAPLAGKTSSVRALARSFGREVYTPEEQDGRTVYFDWLEHTGGRFDGAPIRCRIVSVPGQSHWLQRRLHFLEGADVVVFVGDTSRAAWPVTLESLRDLRVRLDAREGPAVGVVFQANRRDASDALPLEAVREQLGLERIAIIESVAIDGTGVREAFVFAVRLALDRVREEQHRGGLSRRARGPSGEELFHVLRGMDELTPPARTDFVARAAIGAPAPKITFHSSSSDRGALPEAPTAAAPSGLVWPPVEGRIVLREALLGGADIRATRTGDYVASLDTGFRLHSSAGSVFADPEAGRAELVAWARLHAGAQPLLSKRRCLVLAATGDGGWRLWQLVRREPSLRDLLVTSEESSAPELARLIVSASRLLTQAQVLCAAQSLPLHCALTNIGVSELDRPVFVGVFPAAPPRPPSAWDAASVAHELASLIRNRWLPELAALRLALQGIHHTEFGPSSGVRIGQLLGQLLAS